jgi:hypothetical protein
MAVHLCADNLRAGAQAGLTLKWTRLK